MSGGADNRKIKKGWSRYGCGVIAGGRGDRMGVGVGASFRGSTWGRWGAHEMQSGAIERAMRKESGGWREYWERRSV
eukprot:749682-Hanusia_phi.AAC.1